MLSCLLEHIDFIYILEWLSIMCAFTLLDISVLKNRIITAYLIINTLSDAMASFFSCAFNTSNYPVYNISIFFIFPTSFLLLFSLGLITKDLALKAMVVFFTIGFLKLFFFAKPNTYLSLNFIQGSIIFLLLALSSMLALLRNETFDIVDHKLGVLLSAIMVYFLGFSLLFAFYNAGMKQIKLTGNISLYKVLSMYINCIHYGLIIYYIFLSRKKTIMV